MSLVSFFRRPDYRSDTTHFLNALKEQNPRLSERQVAGRALLWDKAVDAEVWQDLRAARVRQKPYVYQTDSALAPQADAP